MNTGIFHVNLQAFFLLAKRNFDEVTPLSGSISSLNYDYESLTHYGRNTFSFNTLPTILTNDPTKSGLIGQRDRLSSTDIQKIKIYYNCGEQLSGLVLTSNVLQMLNRNKTVNIWKFQHCQVEIYFSSKIFSNSLTRHDDFILKSVHVHRTCPSLINDH